MSWESLFQSVQKENDSVILTANQGLARSLLLSYGTFQQNKGLKAWPKPAVMAYQNFFKKWLMNTPEGRSRLLLTPEQCDMVWRDIIDAQEKDILLDAASAAKQARRAEGLLHDYLLSAKQIGDWASLETLRFMSWRKSFWAKMEKQQWWPPEYAMVATIQAIEEGRPLPFSMLILIGFEELTPLQKKWVSSMEHGGIDVTFFTPPRSSSIPQLRQLPTFEDELRAAAHWAQKHLIEKPQHRLGIVMPGLEVFLPQVKHHLGSVLAPETILGETPEKPMPFHLSLGRPLLQWRPVLHLFLFWQLLCSKRDAEDIDMVFRSTFMWGQNSFLVRAHFLGTLKESRKSRLGAFDLRGYQAKYRSREDDADGQQSNWADIFFQVSQAHKEIPSAAYASYWSQYLTGLADEIRWLQGKGVDSALFQLKAAVKKALEEAAKWDLVLGEVSLSSFLSHLKRIWQNTLFQPESQNEPIRVLGILEAMGNDFDAVWVCRMNEGVWPPQGHPNPFIPARIQQEQHMPHASVQRELHFAQLALAWLLKSAPEVHLSFAVQEGNLPMVPSPLLRPWLAEVTEGEVVPSSFKKSIQKDVGKEYFQDWQGEPYCEEVVRGGASLFEYQVQCPFKAYALKRLSVQAPRESEPAVAADQHGELLHATLYEIWGALESQSQLLKLSEEQKENLIRNSIDLSWDKMKKKLSNTSQLFEEAEKRRVLFHVLEWLERESARPAFQVLERERKHEVTLGDRKLHLKIDRVDQLENGATFCMDYKTGKKQTASELVAEPLEKVQLPLYALALEKTPEVIAYGVINAEKKHLIGIGKESSLAQVSLDNKRNNKPASTWSEQVELWRTTLNETLDEYLVGVAARRPIKESVCNFCDARSVCRVDETLTIEEVPHD